MTILQNKIDFAVVLSVKRANPNGDPLNGNRPRTDYNGYGEISDVCLKRKIRDRLQDSGLAIFVQSEDRQTDGAKSLKDRAVSEEWGLGKQAFIWKSKKTKEKDASATESNSNEIACKKDTALKACAKWIDVRTFGNLFAWESSNGDPSVSIPIRGPVSVQSAFSIAPVEVTSTQITKSVSGDGDGTKRSSDTMGMKHRIDEGVYVFYGSMNPQLAERTGFTDTDAETIKSILPKLFENDASSARPEGSMEVLNVVWWKHNCKSGQYSSAKVHRSLTVNPDGGIELAPLDGLQPEILPGF
jgi:CRISPR-associated protein Csd2